MAVVYDKLLDEELSHRHPASDISDFSLLDDRYVNVTGDSMTGDLFFGSSAIGIILTSPGGSLWRVSVDDTGALVTSPTEGGSPMGLLLTLTYAN